MHGSFAPVDWASRRIGPSKARSVSERHRFLVTAHACVVGVWFLAFSVVLELLSEHLGRIVCVLRGHTALMVTSA